MVEQLYTSQKLAQMHESLWECVLQFARFSATQERHRIARDLHDSLGHALTGLNFQLQTAMQLCQADSNQANEFLNEAHRLVKVASQQVRQSVKTLRDDTLETQSLEQLIDSLVSDFEQTTGILPQVEIDLSVAVSSQFIEPIYRIIQEALNNIRKYAKAIAVQIYIYTDCQGLYLKIQDNGRGFDLEKVCDGYGLQGMQERVGILKGNLQIESQPGNGCCITVDIPMYISNNFENLGNFSNLDKLDNFDNLEKAKSTKQEDDFSNISNIDITSNENRMQTEDESPVYPTITNEVSTSIKIGEWQPLNLNYLL